MKRIFIVGGGFSGTMTAVHLIRETESPIEIFLATDADHLNRGVAFNAYSDKQLLNVVASAMSAFSAEPDHFLNWVSRWPPYHEIDEEVLKNSYLPRTVYGKYLSCIWEQALELAATKGVKVELIKSRVSDIVAFDSHFELFDLEKRRYKSDVLVLATGNLLPSNPEIEDPAFFDTSRHYFRNPWDKAAVKDLNHKLPVLIIGNGLTMVDTVLSLVENGFRNEILSISPHGYNLLPHRNSGLVYEKLMEEAKPGMSLYDWVVLFNKHRKMIRSLGMSAEALVDSLRAVSGDIWRSFSPEEKIYFLGRLRHLWGVARHRIPTQVHDKITAFRIQDTLKVVAGKVVRLHDLGDIVEVAYFDKSAKTVRWIDVGRVINCTGPETDIEKGNSLFLKRCLELGLIRQDFLKLGIEAEWPTLKVIDAAGTVHENMYALGNLLRGVYWETTAVKELREQAFITAKGILEKNF